VFVRSERDALNTIGQAARYRLGVAVGAGVEGASGVGLGAGVDAGSTGVGEGVATGVLSGFGEGDGLAFAALPLDLA
jgi:hypothetical protein